MATTTELRTPEAWDGMCIEGIRIKDPDGWRKHCHLGYKSYDEPITIVEFLERRIDCTVQWVGYGRGRKPHLGKNNRV